jgi:predicted extracellular nuclease
MRSLNFAHALRIVAVAARALYSFGPRVHAQPTELFFSEYIEGSSNNKALEIFNGTGTAVNLATDNYNVQMFFNGNPVAGLTINLTGTVGNGDVYVVAQSAAAAAILAQADQPNGAGWYNGDDAVVLRKGTTIIDVIGQIGFDPGTEWGTGLASTADNTLRRKASVVSGDLNGGDVFDPALEWDGFAVDTFSDLGSYLTDTAPSVSSVFPPDGAINVSPGINIGVTFSEPVTVGASAFSLSCAISGTVPVTVSGGPTTYTIDPLPSLPFDDVCTMTVAGAQVSDQDSTDPPDTMANDVVSTFTVTPDPCGSPFTPIYSIQGSGETAAITGIVTTRGVVVGDYEGPSPTLRGFYIQDATGDGDASTSDGIFVFNQNNDHVALGDVVYVTGTATEFQGQTQISASAVVGCGVAAVTPVDVTLPVTSLTDLERFEGMLVRLPQTMYVTEHFQLGRFGQVVLSAGGRLPQPTSVAAPGAAAQAIQAANNLNRIILDDALQNQNADPIVFGRGGQPLSESNTLRGGDSAAGIVGVLTYTWAGNSASGNAYRIRPQNALGGTALFEAANPRPAAAPAVGGSLRIASANVLNYYNTFSDCRAGLTGDFLECRGAEDPAEFQRQRAKTIASLLALSADVVGLIEIENDGYGSESALQDLVNGLNEATAPGTWAFIDADGATGGVDVLGSDGIKVALIYKPAAVTAVGQTAVINTGAFGLFQLADGRVQGRNRPSLAQSFEFATGARVTVVVNHLISKSASCELNVSPVGPDPDTGDGQGVCNLTRVAAVQELMAWLNTDPTGAGDPDYLLLGDFNAYSKEDPIRLLETAGFTNLAAAFAGASSYSFVFDGQWGSLDHGLASPSLAGQITGAAAYHINADEPSVLDFNTNFKTAGQIAGLFAPNEFRSSDHDPIVVGIDLNAVPTVSAGGPYTVTLGSTVLLEATGSDPDGGFLTFEWDLDNNGTFETPGSNASFTGSAIGAYTVRVRATDAEGLSATATSIVNVVFNWTGFFVPIYNSPVQNDVRAGAAVSVRFSLDGNQGLGVLATGFPLSFEVDCVTAAPEGGSPAQNPGGAGLSYDAATQQYVYVWKTDKAWAGTCRRLVVQLIDGTTHDALFRLR